MTRIILFIGGVCALSGFLRAEEPVDWSKFHSAGTVKGVVVKSDSDSITIQVPKLERKKTSGYRGGRNRRPSVKLGHEDIDISYAPNGLVRWEKLPPRADGKSHTSKELETAMKPIGAPKYAAEKTDLKPGHIVELHLVHPKDIKEDKVMPKDVVIKYAIIEGETKPPSHPGGESKGKK